MCVCVCIERLTVGHLPLRFEETGIRIWGLEVERRVSVGGEERERSSWEELRVLEMIGSHVIMVQ